MWAVCYVSIGGPPTLSLKATLLVNSAARGVSKTFDSSKLTRYLAKRGCETSLVLPTSAADATRQARASAERGDDLLFVVGGDGSVRDAALGLAGSETALAAIPAGTVNIWAKESGIPRGIKASLDSHLAGQSVHMDLGRAGDSCFLLMAGVGWDAAIANRVSKRLKKATGDIAYMAQAAWMAPRLRAQPTIWRSGGEQFDEPLAWMVISNTRLYGGKVRLTPDAVIDDGEFDVLAMCPHGFGEAARLVTKVVLGKRSDERIVQRRTAELEIETPGLAVQLDGDFVGETPMKFTVDSRGLLVSVPGGVLAPIFAGVHVDRRKP